MKRFSFNLNFVGNALIVVPVVVLLYIYYPVLLSEWRYRFGAEFNPAPVSQEFSVVIPKLKINETVIANIDAFNPHEYLPILNRGIAHASQSQLPNESGTTYLFAHSSDNPWSATRYNTAFYLLDRLEVGDQIQVMYQGEEYTYQVTKLQVVKPWETEALTSDDTDQLILQTCTPVGTSLNRLLVFADKTKS